MGGSILFLVDHEGGGGGDVLGYSSSSKWYISKRGEEG